VLPDHCTIVREDGSGTAVTELADRVEVRLQAPSVSPPCQADILPIRLSSPLGSRRVVAAGSGTQLTTVTDTREAIPSACTSEASAAAVARDIDQGLSSDILACAHGWMAVNTSQNACPATGDRPDAGCLAHLHVFYFRDVVGRWRIASIGPCSEVRHEFPDVPEDVCQG
jgi:hypothetical protein